MKQLYLLLFTLFAICLSGCVEEPDMDTNLQNVLPPEFEKFTQADVSFTATSIHAKATIKKENGDPVVERGFVYWLKDSKDIQKQEDSTIKEGKSTYELTINELINDTTYHISPFAKSEKGGIAYGDTLDVTTNEGIGSVITSEIKEFTATTAVLGGTIREKGEGEIKKVGFRFHKNAEADSMVYVNMNDMLTDSTFVYTLTELDPETEYTVEAIVENSFGLFNTNKQSFTTLDGHPKLDLLEKIEIDYIQATVRARLVEKGDGELDSIGFCWGTVKDLNRPNIIEDSVIKCTVNEDGFILGVIPSLKPGIQYFVRGFAVNEFGPVYTSDSIAFYAKRDVPTILMDESLNYTMKDGNVTVSGLLENDGRTDVTKIVVYCSLTSTPGPDNESDQKVTLTREDLDKDKKFQVSFTLKGEKKYYVKAYATNENGTEGSNIVEFKTPNIVSGNLTGFEGSGRMNYTVFTLDDQAFVVGGDLGPKRTDELYGYNPTYNKWKLFESYPIEAMNMAACTMDNTAYLFGGNTLAMNITGCYSYSNNEWTDLAPLENGNIRNKAVCFPYGDDIYLIGGNINNAPTDTICRYNTNDNKWYNYGKFAVALSNGIALVSGEGEVFVGLGDKIAGRGLWKATGGDFTSWSSLTELPGKMDNVSSGIIYNRSIYVIDESGVMWQYDIDNDEWHQRYAYSKGSKNYELFMLNGVVYILSLDYYQKTLVTYDPAWDN